jgi:hypothetical protein
MPYDAGALARLFEINFSSSFHYQVPNPGFRTGTEISPIFQTPGVRVQMPYYSNGFLESGSGQTGTGLQTGFDFGLGGILNRGLDVVSQILPALRQPTATRVPTTQPNPGTATRPPSEHMPTGPMGGPGRRGRVARVGIPAAVAGAIAGYHIIKRGPNAGQMTKNRHRNPGNIHALRRSISRIRAFEKICRKVVHFVRPSVRGRMQLRRRSRRK